MYGGSITYDFSEQTRLDASLGENLVPSSSGVLTKNDSVNASLIHQFSDTLTGRLGASYTRSIFPGALSEFNNSSYSGEIGATYRLAERWILETGYRYTGAQYSGNALEPRSNFVFLSVAYNWPGASFTSWVGTRPDMQGLPGAGPLSLPVRPVDTQGPTSAPAPPAGSPARSPFDQLSIP